MTQDAIYLRKSRADVELERLEKFETLARHKKILKDLAIRDGYNIVAIYEEIVSGESIEARPQMQQLLDDVSAGKYDNVLVMEIERLARGNTRDQGIVAEVFQYSNTNIVTPSKVYDPSNEFDQEYFEFGLFMSRREYKTIQRRLNAGRISSVKDGNYIGSIPPYGFDIVHPDKKTYTLEPNTHESRISLMIKNWRLTDNLSWLSIAKKLNAMGIKTRKNTEWTAEGVKAVALNPANAGYVKWNSRKTVTKIVDGNKVKSRPRANNDEILLTKAKWDGIYTPEEYKALVDSTSMNAPKLHGNKELQNPLAGLLFCKECGKAMVFKRLKGCQDRYQHVGIGGSCNIKSCIAQEVFDIIIDAIKNEISSFELLINSTVEQVSNNSEQILSEYQKELGGLKKQKEKLFDLFEREVYSEDEFIERRNVINTKISNLEKIIAEEKKKAPIKVNYKAKIVSFTEAMNILQSDNVSAKQKNDVLKTVIKRIDYSNEGTIGINRNGIVHLDIYFL